MKKLEINITKAALKSFSVELADEKPVVTASIALLTDGGKMITDYTISTESWRGDNKFELPVTCIAPIIALAKELEAVVVKHCRDSQLALPAPELTIDDIPTIVKPIPATPEEIDEINDKVMDDLENAPINLDDIPF